MAGERIKLKDIELGPEIQKQIILKGFIFKNKIVRKFSDKNGAFYVPKRWIGKAFTMILIPEEAIEGEIKAEDEEFVI